MITHEIDVLIGADNPGIGITVKCHDTGICVRANLKQVITLSRYRTEEKPYKIPDACTVVLKIAKPNNTYVLQKGEPHGTYACFVCHKQAFTSAGQAKAEINIFGPDGRRITSATFYANVSPEAANDCSEDSETYVDILADQIAQANNAAARAEAAAKRAESSGGGGGGAPGEPGEDGGYYVPHVDADGDLSWTPSGKYMPAVDTVNIKGAKGDKGEPGKDGKDATPYTLPTASADVKGGVKVGEGLRMDGDVLSTVGGTEGEFEFIKEITLTAEQAGTKLIDEILSESYRSMLVTIEMPSSAPTLIDTQVVFGDTYGKRGCSCKEFPQDYSLRAVIRPLNGIWDIFGYVGHRSSVSNSIGQIACHAISPVSNSTKENFGESFEKIKYVGFRTFGAESFHEGMKIKLYGVRDAK